MAKTEEEKKKIGEEALKHLAGYEKELNAFKAEGEDLDSKWSEEIEMLQRHVTETINVSIGKKKGETIAIYASPSDAIIKEIIKLDNYRAELDPKKDFEIITKLTDFIMAHLTANPAMTPEWFANNRERYSTVNMNEVFMFFLERLSGRAKTVSQIKNFR